MTILFSLPPSLPFSTHPEQTGADPNPGLNPLHQLDLRKKHSSIPERRRHISGSSGNRGRLMRCRLALAEAAWSEKRLPNKVIEKSCVSNQLALRVEDAFFWLCV